MRRARACRRPLRDLGLSMNPLPFPGYEAHEIDLAHTVADCLSRGSANHTGGCVSYVAARWALPLLGCLPDLLLTLHPSRLIWDQTRHLVRSLSPDLLENA